MLAFGWKVNIKPEMLRRSFLYNGAVLVARGPLFPGFYLGKCRMGSVAVSCPRCCLLLILFR